MNVFENLSLEIKSGHKVAFVGPSGCGKSTIIQFLLRFYDPDQGTIELDGRNIKDYDIHYLRDCFGVVSQEPVLFNGTFADNIRYDNDKATMKEIEDAAKSASAYDFITGSEKLANDSGSEENGKGFDKNVGVRGGHISGGQKQRVAIARAVLKKPKALLLDEATSALDSENEKKVQAALDSIMANKTSISVAHRIETIKNSDVIYVFEKGKIVEEGTYQKLLGLKGHFYNLEKGTTFL